MRIASRKLIVSAALAGLSLMGYATTVAHAGVTPLFMTQDDWSAANGWSGQNGSTVSTVASSVFDTDGSSVNGAGNETAAAAAGTPGALKVNFGGTGFAAVAEISNEQNNPAFMSLFDPGGSAGTAVNYNGEMQLEYTIPTLPSGGFFQIGLFLQYQGDGYYGPMLSSSQVADSNGVNNTGQTEMLATIPYSIVGPVFNGLGFGIFVNTNAAAGTFYVDGLQQVAVPEPASLGVLSLGGLALLRRRRSR